MSATGDQMNALAAEWVSYSTKTATDPAAALDSAHFGRLLNDEYARLAVAGTLAKSGEGVGGIPISSGSTIVQILSTLGVRPSTSNWQAGSP